MPDLSSLLTELINGRSYITEMINSVSFAPLAKFPFLLTFLCVVHCYLSYM